MKLVLILLVLVMVCIAGVSYVGINYEEDVEVSVDEIYSGPVQLGYDVEHFRETGETILEDKG